MEAKNATMEFWQLKTQKTQFYNRKQRQLTTAEASGS